MFSQQPEAKVMCLVIARRHQGRLRSQSFSTQTRQSVSPQADSECADFHGTQGDVTDILGIWGRVHQGQ